MATDEKVYDAIGREEIIEFLNKIGIKANLVDENEHGFSRTISFTVYEIEYRIVWFINNSTLYIGNNKRAACIPFKYMYLDTTFPLVGGNRSIGFSYTKLKKESMFDRSFPYEVFRIPIEL